MGDLHARKRVAARRWTGVALPGGAALALLFALLCGPCALSAEEAERPDDVGGLTAAAPEAPRLLNDAETEAGLAARLEQLEGHLAATLAARESEDTSLPASREGGEFEPPPAPDAPAGEVTLQRSLEEATW